MDGSHASTEYSGRVSSITADLQTWLLLAQSAAEALRKRRRNVRAVGTVSSKLSAPQMSSSMRRISRLVYVLSVM